jgi:hypothetical protein
MTSRQHLLLARLSGFFMFFFINVNYGVMNEKKIMRRAAGVTPDANGR